MFSKLFPNAPTWVFPVLISFLFLSATAFAQDTRAEAYDYLEASAKEMRIRLDKLPMRCLVTSYTFETRNSANQKLVSFTEGYRSAVCGVAFRNELTTRKATANNDIRTCGEDLVKNRVVIFDGGKLYHYSLKKRNPKVNEDKGFVQADGDRRQVLISTREAARAPIEGLVEHPMWPALLSPQGQEWYASFHQNRIRNLPASVLKKTSETIVVKMQNLKITLSPPLGMSIIALESDMDAGGFETMKIEYQTINGSPLPTHYLHEEHVAGNVVTREVTLSDITESNDTSVFSFSSLPLAVGTPLMELDAMGEVKTTSYYTEPKR